MGALLGRRADEWNSRCRLTADRNMFWVLQMLLSNLRIGRGHGCRKKDDLPFLRRLSEDPFHIFNESHLQHLIGFVEHDGFEVLQVQSSATHVVHNTARRTNHHMHATVQIAQLRFVAPPP